MPTFRRAQVTAVIGERKGLQRVRVGEDRGYVLTDLTGSVAVGDDVILNTTAVELGLGTGGWHVVHWNLARSEWVHPGPGHIMKMRYTSLQADTGAAEEELGDLGCDLGGIPVVVCGLHSQVPLVAAAFRSARPEAVIAYVMTDGAALPLALSDLVAQMLDGGVIDHTVSAGHAFGGELEAVTVASGLVLAVKAQQADLVIVAMGPGVVGTGTTLGTTAIEVAGILDTVAWLGGRPVACLRVSDGDARGRHQGISHHSKTALEAVRSEVAVALPIGLDPSDLPKRHSICPVDVPDVAEILAALDINVTTMGRGAAEEPTFFAAGAAAGILAATIDAGRGDS